MDDENDLKKFMRIDRSYAAQLRALLGGVGAQPNMFSRLAAQTARDELEKISRLEEAGHTDLLEKIADGELAVDDAMQIFGGRRP